MDERQSFITAEAPDAGKRLDQFLTERFPQQSRSFWQKQIKNGSALVDNTPVKTGYLLREGDKLTILLPEPENMNILAEDIPLDILYEDDDLLVVNKPKGMVVHPAAGHTSGTLVNALLWHCKDGLSGINGVIRPGIVHRIDRDTTGSLIVCKNDHAHNYIASQLAAHTSSRLYEAIVHGTFASNEGTIDAPIGRHPVDRKRMAIQSNGGKEAITHFQVLESFGRYSHIRCRLETGRTHQIRVHLSSIGHPLLGDCTYGSKVTKLYGMNLQGQCLHAEMIGFLHPSTGEYMEFHAPLPEYFQTLLEQMKKQ